MRSISVQIYNYYNYHHRYEFTLAPLNYYERQKIKLNIRINKGLDKLDNYAFLQIGDNKKVTRYKKSLNLYDNRLTKLPSNICKLRSLQRLCLCHNQLTDLPLSLCKLKSLEYICMGENKLTHIPVCIGKLKSLRYYHISVTQMTDENIEYLKIILPFLYS